METNYLPLFRKYRPQTFADVIGQEVLVQTLTNAIELNRIANAYLFCGPRGTGKTSCARIFAKSLNCTNGPTIFPCQKCPSCVDITNTSGLDVIEIDAASNRGIQDAKELISQVQYAPINGKYKIFIIDEVHMLSNDAFNALLKTFEEPPKNVIFILATTEPHKVLETIVSRCQRFDFRRISVDDIVKRLRKISDIENIKITSNALYTIAKNVSGGMRDSLALLDQVSILGVKNEIDKDLIEDLLGKINFDKLLNLLKDISDENIEKSIIDIDNIYSKGCEPRNLAENFIEFLRNIILVLSSENTEKISDFTTLCKDDFEKIKELNFNKDKILKILNIIIEYHKEIKISANPYLWMELAVIAACRLDISEKQNNIQLQAAINSSIQKTTVEKITPQAFKEDIVSSQITKQQPMEQNIVSTSPVGFSSSQNKDTAQIWTEILSAIPSLPIKALYSGTAKLIKIENNTVTLGFTHDNALTQAKLPAKFNVLDATVKNLYPEYKIEMIKVSQDVKYIKPKQKAFKVDMQPKTPQIADVKSTFSNQADTIAEKPQIQKSKAEILEDIETEPTSKQHYSPKVQEMIEQFNGKIIE